MKIYSFLNVKGKILKHRTTKSFFSSETEAVAYVAMPQLEMWVGQQDSGQLANRRVYALCAKPQLPHFAKLAAV